MISARAIFALATTLAAALPAGTQQVSPAPGQKAPEQPATGEPAPSPAQQKLETELARDRKILADWPNLGRFRAENATLPAVAAKQDRVVFMGDSITDFWGRTRGQFFPGKPSEEHAHNRPGVKRSAQTTGEFLCCMAARSRALCAYVNRGISGQTTPQMLIRFRPDVIALRPRVVVILAGTNDLAGNTGPESLEDIEANLASMVELAQSHQIRVVLSSLLPVCDYIKPQTARRPPEQIVALNGWMKQYCAQKGLIYLDYFTPMLDEHGMLKKELTIDGLHPNEAGYEVMGPLAATAIADALTRN